MRDISPVATLSTARRNYALFLLMMVATVNWLDRQVLNILIVPIRKEMSLTDTEIGLITGIAFIALYAVVSLPAARLADRWSRRKVLTISLTFWSLMTIACGMAQTFGQLFVARMGVGLGEGSGSAPAQASVGDMFKREQRATALSIFFLSAALGIALGLLWGGLAVDKFGWRTAFIMAGIPGVILAPLVYFTLPDIRPGQADGVEKPLAQLPFWKTIWALLRMGSFRNMLLGSSVKTFLATGLSAWVPSFLARSHGMSTATIGVGLATISIFAYAIGALVGGRMVDVLGQRDARWQFWVAGIAVILSGGAAASAFLVPTGIVLIVLGAQMIFGALWAGGLTAITQHLAPVSFRATANASVMFVVNFVAFGIGPSIIGYVSDRFRPAYGEESLRVTLLCVTVLALPASFLFYRAARTYRADLETAHAMDKVA